MAEIAQVFTIARCLYSPDSVPWAQLLLPTNIGQLTERYRFNGVRQMEAVGGGGTVQLICTGGQFSSSGTMQAVQQLIIEANVAQCQVAGNTEDAEAFLGNLEHFFEEVDPAKKGLLNQYTRTYQTVAIARLNVPFDAMLSDKMQQYLAENVIPKLQIRDAKAHVKLANLSWQVIYNSEGADYMYLPKVLTIEPRAGSKLSDRIYYTFSPTDFETHKKLLEEFETVLGSGKAAKTSD